jgi:hypothetical protein
MSQTLSPIDFVDQVKTILETKDEFNFSILVEMNPIKKRFTYVCKPLAIIVKLNDKLQYIHYDKILEHQLNYIEIKENHLRKVGVRKTPFFIDGSSKVQNYKDNDYIEYSFRNPSKNDLKFVEKIREKFNITVPREFVGERLGFNDDLG